VNVTNLLVGGLIYSSSSSSVARREGASEREMEEGGGGGGHVGLGWGMDDVSALVEAAAGRSKMKKMGSFGPESGLGRWLEME